MAASPRVDLEKILRGFGGLGKIKCFKDRITIVILTKSFGGWDLIPLSSFESASEALQCKWKAAAI